MSLDIYLEETYPACSGCGRGEESITHFERNITHNVSPMWRKAGVYEALYESHGKQAVTLVGTLATGLKTMNDNMKEYQALNPSNGWGNVDGAYAFLLAFYHACLEHTKAVVRVSK